MIIDKIKKLNIKIKLIIGFIISIIGSFIFINQRKNSIDKKNDNSQDSVNNLEGQNIILKENIHNNKNEISNIDKVIDETKDTISNIDNIDNDEDIDDFFDKRGF